MKAFVIFFIVSIFFLQQPCISFSSEAQASVPHRVSIEREDDIAALSAKEKKWYLEFQEGNLFCDGWQEISTDILAHTPQESIDQQSEALAKLGHKIGMEWSKDNNIRRINTSMLKKWGSILKKTSKKQPEQLNQVLASIEKEVDTILQ